MAIDVTRFPKASGNMLGSMIYMDKTSPKKGKPKDTRILHAYLEVGQKIDSISIDIPKHGTPDDLRRWAAAMNEFADRCEVEDKITLAYVSE
ncbi:hypothetical protein ACYPKM_02475 [Pseudomonas aeruginosa]